MANVLSIETRIGHAAQPHVEVVGHDALPLGAGDPACDARGPARFVPLPAGRRKRYAAVDALVTFATLAGFVAALGALGFEAAASETSERWTTAVARAIGSESAAAVAQALGPVSDLDALRRDAPAAL
jgi:hypothetical protein